MDNIQRANFLNNNADVAYFEADKALYKKVFPESNLNKSLDTAPKYRKGQLDERMLLELLQSKTPNEILDFRKQYAGQSKQAKTEKNVTVQPRTDDSLLLNRESLQAVDYQDLKEIASIKEIDFKGNPKKDDLIELLIEAGAKQEDYTSVQKKRDQK